MPGAVRTPKKPTAPVSLTMTVERGDTLDLLLRRAGASAGEAHLAGKALSTYYNPRSLQVGQQITVSVEPYTATDRLVSLEIDARFDRFVGVTRYPDGSFQPYEVEKTLQRETKVVRATIDHSLFADGVAAGATPAVMAEFLRLFSFDIDFQRDIHKGDELEIAFEQFLNRQGKVIHRGKLLFAGLKLRGELRQYYRHVGEDSDDAFYDAKGRGLRKALLRTPIDGVRLSSGYGMRRHPVLGYTRMHKGVDFAAPYGTPIKAAGNGEITFIGRQRGYGRFITIRHNRDYTTAYAHMSRFARGMAKGKRVKQGQIIAYVGSSGMSTGSHLHYEVRHKGRQVNPSRLRLPSDKRLEGPEFDRFRRQIATIDMLRGDSGSPLVAANPER